MAALPFNFLTPLERSFFKKISGKELTENALIELNNKLAESQEVSEISPDLILELSNKYKINFYQTFSAEMEKYYENYLRYCLSDKHLSPKEVEDLKHLKILFGLNDQITKTVHQKLTGAIYGKAVQEIMMDHDVSEEEKKFLKSIQTNLLISDELAEEIYSSQGSELLQGIFDKATSDKRLSPDEEQEMQKIAQSLGASLEFDEKTKGVLDRYRYFWRIENGEIPEINVEINLQKGEKCYFQTQANWYELRTQVSRIRYGGLTTSIKLIGPLRLRLGDIALQPVSHDYFKLIDSGKLFLTNKRLLFIGTNKNSTIQLAKILEIQLFKNGVQIQKGSGKSPVLEFDPGSEIFAAILGRAINDLKQ